MKVHEVGYTGHREPHRPDDFYWWLEVRHGGREQRRRRIERCARRCRAGSQGALRACRPGRRRAGLHLTERSAGGSVERRQRPRQQLTDAIV
ncbi:MAG: hypothetical protein M3O92_07405, partial [Actinomycetota bacterium]|nr:hypothetical protein [Actinomycetota bacterium]